MRRDMKGLLAPDKLATFGAGLKQARVARNLTLAAAAERSGVSRASIARIERGDPSVAFGAYAAYLQMLGLLEQLARAIAPAQDELGERLRAQQVRKRPRSPSAEQGARYDF